MLADFIKTGTQTPNAFALDVLRQIGDEYTFKCWKPSYVMYASPDGDDASDVGEGYLFEHVSGHHLMVSNDGSQYEVAIVESDGEIHDHMECTESSMSFSEISNEVMSGYLAEIGTVSMRPGR